MPTINLIPVGIKSVEACIREAYESFNVPPLGGASNDGWSKLNDFQRCPYRYYMLHERKQDLISLSAKPNSLEIGALFHAMLAMHYVQHIPMGKYTLAYPRAFELSARVAELGANIEIVDECNRLYTAYFDAYGNAMDEQIHPLAVELGAGIDGIHTCRFDMLAKIHGGTWIVEHKTASRDTRDVLEGWWLDGEILGEVLGYKLSGLDKVFGPLVGVLVNVVIKTKEPKFRRVEVVITDALLDQYQADSAYWRKQRVITRESGYWPRKLNGCIGRYGTCELWDHCRDANTSDDERLNRLLTQSLKEGEP